ncbi:family 1 glycosylhydrolase [Amycolatopsis methanolica]|uniref:family 1 glycosylhydrolase n=1 Tax=Amycolatopsis methanolica TaxID=1814 RepID=UPI0003A0A1BA|nr:family 1 glycosylhydrolase [Amycolatopsis methanolica]
MRPASPSTTSSSTNCSLAASSPSSPCTTSTSGTQALEDRGGWNSRDTVEAFVRYAGILFREYGGKVNYWLTINEQNMMVLHGAALGMPGRGTLSEAYQRNHHMLVAQARDGAVPRAPAALEDLLTVAPPERQPALQRQLDVLVAPGEKSPQSRRPWRRGHRPKRNAGKHHRPMTSHQRH